MTPQTSKFIVLDWHEKGFNSITKHERPRNNRQVFTYLEYPTRLPCSNPDCEDGGFEIGERIAALLASGNDDEQNSLICRNAIHPDRAKRCLHAIRYTISCIYPYQRQRPDATLRQPIAPLSR